MEHLSVISEFKKFSIAEKILILEELWDSIAREQEDFELTDEHRDAIAKVLLNAFLFSNLQPKTKQANSQSK